MASTCSRLLDLCLRGERIPSELLDACIAEDDGRALLSVVVERLGDLFEPRLCDVYAGLFTEVIHRVAPDLAQRIRRAQSKRAAPNTANRIYVLSRITLGADVAVTSVLLDAAKRRYPSAEIFFVGPQKNFELFQADERLQHFPAPYARSGALEDRLDASASLWFEDGVVIDPDSRLTQLGLIQVCPDDRYLFFESRSYGGDSNARLPDLASRWAFETFGVEYARPYVAPLPSDDADAEITVSLGVGENPAKRIGGTFERDLLALLASTGRSVLVDKGGSPEEKRRVEEALPGGARTHEGAFGPFADLITRSRLFVGYDSAAGHVASAAGVPVISIAQGFVCERMAQRWRPLGSVVSTLDEVAAAMNRHP